MPLQDPLGALRAILPSTFSFMVLFLFSSVLVSRPLVNGYCLLRPSLSIRAQLSKLSTMIRSAATILLCAHVYKSLSLYGITSLAYVWIPPHPYALPPAKVISYDLLPCQLNFYSE
eukprot:4992691-Amphidinium_carterae.1